MVRVMELSPHEFHEIGEEALRSHFLVQLNGAYKGLATGETFNFQGKTDILIRVDGKNVFIGECKFWKGTKALLETISQLLSYLSWRDTKAAVLVFNRNIDFSAVLAKIKDGVPKHPNYKRDEGAPDESTFRYVFAQPNDASREMILTVPAFDIPTDPADIKSIGAGFSGGTSVGDLKKYEFGWFRSPNPIYSKMIRRGRSCARYSVLSPNTRRP